MYELTIDLDVNRKIPFYEQIYEFIKEDIKNGRIGCKTKLPSTRALAKHLQVSRSTVDMAYTQLLSEGYIESVPCKGYFVSEISLLYNINNISSFISDQEDNKENRISADEIDFSPWGINLDAFPFNAWRKISKNLLSADNKEIFAAGSPKGERNFRETLCNYLYEARGVHCSPEMIIIGAGNEYLLMLLNELFSEKPVIAMENPTYKQAYRVYKHNGNTIIPISMDKNGMKVKDLNQSGASIAYVMPSHQFPMGTVMPIKRRLELLTWTKMESNHYVIEDDYDSEFRYLGKPIPSLQGVDDQGKVIYMGTFSKSIAPAIRMSYMILPPDLIKVFNQKLLFHSQTVSKIDQMVVNEFIKQGYYERHLNKMRSIYRAKHDLMLALLKDCGKQISISGENSGLHILVTVHNNMSEAELVSRAKSAGVAVHGLNEYYISPRTSTKPTILLGFANLSESSIKNGIQKLKKAWRFI